MKPKFKELLFASFEFEDYNPNQTKLLLLNAMFFITILINLIFMFINLFLAQTYMLSFVNLTMITVLGYALYILREKENYDAASYIGNVTLFIAFIFTTVLKESAHYSLIWTYFFTPFAILTLGARKGLILSLFFLTVIIAIGAGGLDTWDRGEWNLETLFRFTISQLVMLYLIYAIQNSNELANEKIKKLRQKERLQLKVMEKISVTDTLTSLYNRRFFEEIFPRQLKHAKSNNEYFTFFILDLDYFKQYNDTYGHQQGDWALIQIADVLKEVFSKSDDYTFRMGGEEFSAIFLDDDMAHIQSLIQSIHERLAEKEIEHKGNPVEDILTCSIGVYVKEGEDDLSHQNIYRLADEALYRAKGKGRNQTRYV